MSIGVIALLLGLFGAPALLLWAGHHWRYTPPMIRGAFWGGLFAHTVGAIAATVAGLFRPAEWGAGDELRGFFGLWSMLVFFVIGAALGALLNRNAPPARARAARPSRDGTAVGLTD